MRVLIVGAGISGIALAGLLEQQGVSVTIVEQAVRPRAEGFGITIMAAGLAVLGKLGLREAVLEAGTVAESCEITTDHGHTLTRLNLRAGGITAVTIERAQLIKMLIARLQSTSIQWQTSLRSINADHVTLTDGSMHQFDLIVGADGIYSQVRSLIFPSVKPKPVGAAIWMGVYNSGQPSHGIVRLTLGPGLLKGVFPLDNKTVVTLSRPFVGADLDGRTAAQPFTKLGQDTGTIITSAEFDNFYRDQINQIKLRRWHHDRVVLIGDAAHAMAPATAMSASINLQDAAALSQCLESVDNPAAILPTFQRQRYRPARRAQRQAYVVGRVLLMGGPASVVRDLVIRHTPDKLVLFVIKKILQ